MESHLVLIENVSDSMLPLFHDLDLDYILQKPFTAERIVLKLQHMWRTERELTEFEMALRHARSAWHSGLVDMTREICLQLLKDHGFHEKSLLLLASTFMKENNISDARKCLHAIVKANLQSSAALHLLAKSHMQENDFKQASIYLNSLVYVSPISKQLDKHDRRAGEVLAKVAMSEGNVEGVVQVLFGKMNLCMRSTPVSASPIPRSGITATRRTAISLLSSTNRISSRRVRPWNGWLPKMPACGADP